MTLYCLWLLFCNFRVQNSSCSLGWCWLTLYSLWLLFCNFRVQNSSCSRDWWWPTRYCLLFCRYSATSTSSRASPAVTTTWTACCRQKPSTRRLSSRRRNRKTNSPAPADHTQTEAKHPAGVGHSLHSPSVVYRNTPCRGIYFLNYDDKTFYITVVTVYYLRTAWQLMIFFIANSDAILTALTKTFQLYSVWFIKFKFVFIESISIG